MTTELNLELILGETWVIGFDAPSVPTGALVAFELAQGDVPLFFLNSADDPSAVNVENGSVTITPDLQDGLSADTYLYEIRSTAPDDTVACLAFGRIMAGASLFGLTVPAPVEPGDV